MLILVSVLLVSTWIHIRRGHRHSGQRPSCSAVHFSSRGRARWVGGRRWALSRRRQSSKSVSFYFPFISFFGKILYSFTKCMVSVFSLPLGMLVAKWEPTPCYRDAYSVGTPNWAFRMKGWQKHCKTMFPPFFWTFLFGEQKNIFLFWVRGYSMDVPFW